MYILEHFNSGQKLNHQFYRHLEVYFDYRWSFDKSAAVKQKEDIDLLSQMPSEVQIELYSNFLYRVFLTRFSKFFRFPKTVFNSKTHA